MELQRVVVVGSGNLSEALAAAVARSDVQLVQVFARNRQRGPEVARLAGLTARAADTEGAGDVGMHACGDSRATAAPAWTDDPQQLATADLYLLAVSDRAVAEVAEALPIPETAVVAHTAGSVPLDALARFARRGVLYPLQTFTAGRPVDFGAVPLFLEASTPEVLDALEGFARRLSRTVCRADSAQRARIHLAGVFACNFANAMYVAGETILQRAGLPYPLIKTLIAETAAKACETASPRNVQTGPAVRNDRATQERHEALLADDPQLQTIYRLISKQIWETSK